MPLDAELGASARRAHTPQPRFALLLGLAWLLACARLLYLYWDTTEIALPDTDDAMRLVQVRDFIAGQGWFDLHQPRLAPPAGYDSHWSRLVDAGLSGLFFVFQPFTDVTRAERLMRTVWPLLWILPTMAGASAIAWRIAGREAALVTLVLALAGGSAYLQSIPGRIDHHNVQIGLTMLTVAATVWSDRKIWCAAAAGAVTALTLAIGFEALPYLAGCGAAIALRFVFTNNGAAALRAYAASIASASVALFVVSVGPDRWLQVHCDALAINGVAALVSAAVILTIAGFSSPERLLTRGFYVALSGVAAVAVIGVLEPRCLLGPYAMVDPRAAVVWLSHVHENQPALRMLLVSPLIVTSLTLFAAVTLVTLAVIAFRADLRRDFGFLVSAAIFLLACLTTLAAIRASFYAQWLAMPLMAVALMVLFQRFRITAWWRRLAIALLVSPFALSTAAATLLSAAGIADSTKADGRYCIRTDNYRLLGGLPKGLVVANIAHGPYILALTPHQVMSAPYHRLSEAIIASHRILSASPDEARERAHRIGATYIALCGPAPAGGLSEDQVTRSLWAHLQAGAVPDWLDPVTATIGHPFTVFRVLP